MKACVDTHVLIWGILEQARESQRQMVADAKYLLEELEKARDHVIVPAPVLMEVLLGLEPARHQSFLSRLARQFVIAPFDARAAAEAASIWLATNAGRSISAGLQSALKSTRNEIRCDTMILGIAVSRGASALYTEDSTLISLAKRIGRIEAMRVTQFRKQKVFPGHLLESGSTGG